MPTTTHHEFGFEEIESAFAMVQNKKDSITKPLIHFDWGSLRSLFPPTADQRTFGAQKEQVIVASAAFTANTHPNS